MNILIDSQKKLRSFWWIAIFFLILAAFTFPFVVAAQHYNWEISIHLQAVIVVVTTIICQAMGFTTFLLSSMTSVPYDMIWSRL